MAIYYNSIQHFYWRTKVFILTNYCFCLYHNGNYTQKSLVWQPRTIVLQPIRSRIAVDNSVDNLQMRMILIIANRVADQV